jgi:hypothetical protein
MINIVVVGGMVGESLRNFIGRGEFSFISHWQRSARDAKEKIWLCGVTRSENDHIFNAIHC